MRLRTPSPVQELLKPEWASTEHIRIKRDDLIHPIISGNKARKLQCLIDSLDADRPERLLTMGGNRSNFLHALGYLCHQKNISLSAFIRGHQPEHYGKTLQDLNGWNVDLQFIDKATFQKLREDKSYAEAQAKQLKAHWLPEGGSDTDALHGIIRAIDELDAEPDSLFVPIGTGCTALGLALGIQQRGWKTKVIGVVVLKGVRGANGIAADMQKLAQEAGFTWPSNLYLEYNFCGKGFGKQSPELKQQKDYFTQLWNIPLDPVYSVKMCNAFKYYAETNHPHLGKHVLLWHTGGLQGNQ